MLHRATLHCKAVAAHTRPGKVFTLDAVLHGQERRDPQKPGRVREQLHAVTLAEGAVAMGRPLAELDLENPGAMVTAVRRGGIRGPEPETRLQPGDVLVLYGEPEALARAETLLLTGQ